MPDWFFVSDLHGSVSRYRKLIDQMLKERPQVVMIGGDLLPTGPVNWGDSAGKFFRQLLRKLEKLKTKMGSYYPNVIVILGNDDPRSEEAFIFEGENQNLWRYAHNRKIDLFEYSIYGYAFIPPSPFMLKDWERYDVSRYVEPGCIPPEDGWYTTPIKRDEIAHHTILDDLNQLTPGANLKQAIFLFHAPPYNTPLDEAALHGKTYENTPLDVHVGSIAIRRFIETRQPYITLHGHIHESSRLSGSWKVKLGGTYAFSAAHDGNELALIRFDPQSPEKAQREVI
jgi:uncharacterized protein